MKICECGSTPKVIDVSTAEAPITSCEYEFADRCRVICKCGKKSVVYVGGYMESARRALESGQCDIEWED